MATRSTARPRRARALRLAVLFVLILLLALGLDARLQVTRYDIMDIRLPPGLDGFTVVQISDLHGYVFGDRQARLIAAVTDAQPDLIVLTGDIIDRADADLSAVEPLLDGIAGLCPIYAVTGNHELDNDALLPALNALYDEAGVRVLENERAEVSYAGGRVYVGGLRHGAVRSLPAALSDVPGGAFSLLLYHKATRYEALADLRLPYGYMFTGHTHGGIIRLPLLGGVIDNDRNLFPKYDGGLFDELEPMMICSRGLGNSSRLRIPRFHNRPELVVITFACIG